MSNQSIFTSIIPESEVVKKLILEPKKAARIEREIKNRYEIYCSMYNIATNVIDRFKERNISEDEFIECLISFFNESEASYFNALEFFRLSTYTSYRSLTFNSYQSVEVVLERKIELKDLLYPEKKISFNTFKRDFLKIDLEAARPVEPVKTKLHLILTKDCMCELFKKADDTARKLIECEDLKGLKLFWMIFNFLDPETRNLMRERLSPFNLILIDFIAFLSYNPVPTKTWWSKSYKKLTLEDLTLLMSKAQLLYKENHYEKFDESFYSEFFSSSFVKNNLHPDVYTELQIAYII